MRLSDRQLSSMIRRVLREDKGQDTEDARRWIDGNKADGDFRNPSHFHNALNLSNRLKTHRTSRKLAAEFEAFYKAAWDDLGPTKQRDFKERMERDAQMKSSASAFRVAPGGERGSAVATRQDRRTHDSDLTDFSSELTDDAEENLARRDRQRAGQPRDPAREDDPDPDFFLAGLDDDEDEGTQGPAMAARRTNILPKGTMIDGKMYRQGQATYVIEVPSADINKITMKVADYPPKPSARGRTIKLANIDDDHILKKNVLTTMQHPVRVDPGKPEEEFRVNDPDDVADINDISEVRVSRSDIRRLLHHALND